MACGDDLKNLLSRYVDGELSPEERARAEEHVAACVPCRELLQIFQKNESLLSNALSTESFGNTVIEGVISELKREAQPIEAKPIDEGASEWFRNRPTIALAAAALFVVGLVGILSVSHNRDIQKMQELVAGQTAKVQALTDTVSAVREELEKTLIASRIDDAMRHAPSGRTISAYISSAHHLVVRSSFDLKHFGSSTSGPSRCTAAARARRTTSSSG
jgi:predicted anti-sigma-YlaC factor YlaD